MYLPKRKHFQFYNVYFIELSYVEEEENAFAKGINKEYKKLTCILQIFLVLFTGLTFTHR